MENYKKWRRMVFDIIKDTFYINITPGTKRDQHTRTDDTIRIDKEGGYWGFQSGIASCNSDSFNDFFKLDYTEFYGEKWFREDCICSKSKTRTIYKEKKNDLLVAYSTTNALENKTLNDGFIITIEEVKYIQSEQKKKFLFMDGELVTQCTFSTFKAMAEKGYKCEGHDLVLYPSVSEYADSHLKYFVKDDLKVWNEGIYNIFRNTLPKLVELYKNNSMLYEKAIAEITGDADEYED